MESATKPHYSVESSGIWVSGKNLLEGIHRTKQFSMTDPMPIFSAVKTLSINFIVELTLLPSSRSCFESLFLVSKLSLAYECIS